MDERVLLEKLRKLRELSWETGYYAGKMEARGSDDPRYKDYKLLMNMAIQARDQFLNVLVNEFGEVEE